MSLDKSNGSNESDPPQNYEGEPVVARIGDGKRLPRWRPDEDAPPVDVKAIEAMYLLQLGSAEEYRVASLVVSYRAWHRASMEVLLRLIENERSVNSPQGGS
jgi:hypothetical protein